MSSLLPPGFCFFPSDDQLFTYYLTNKNRTGGAADATPCSVTINGYDVVRELDLYEYSPFELPESACYEYFRHGQRRRHWYCYSEVRDLAEGRRRAKGGFWIMRGKARGFFLPGGDALIGKRTRFVYYSGESDANAVRTHWVLYEYSLSDRFKASFVLCRVFIKSHSGNIVSENALGTSTEESTPAACYNGVQHDGFHIPKNVGAKVHPYNTSNRLEKISSDLLTLKLTCDKISRDVLGLSHDLDYQIGETVETSRNNLHTEADQQIPEDDFLELDDLRD
uniref:NAC transcription factor 061 n=1 Tax=Rhizophora mucronata TaxID=61149 RepID=A0A2P2IVH2_RHIMU